MKARFLLLPLAVFMTAAAVAAAPSPRQSRVLRPTPLLPISCQDTPCYHQTLDQSVIIIHSECDPETFCQNDQCYYYSGSSNNCCTARQVCCTYTNSLGYKKYVYEMVGDTKACAAQPP